MYPAGDSYLLTCTLQGIATYLHVPLQKSLNHCKNLSFSSKCYFYSLKPSKHAKLLLVIAADTHYDFDWQCLVNVLRRLGAKIQLSDTGSSVIDHKKLGLVTLAIAT
jgi:hypothetical protein